jgi:hypothetical protein
MHDRASLGSVTDSERARLIHSTARVLMPQKLLSASPEHLLPAHSLVFVPLLRLQREEGLEPKTVSM